MRYRVSVNAMSSDIANTLSGEISSLRTLKCNTDKKHGEKLEGKVFEIPQYGSQRPRNDNLKSNKKDEQDNRPIRLFRFKLNSNFKQKFFPLTSAFIRATNHSRKGKSKRGTNYSVSIKEFLRIVLVHSFKERLKEYPFGRIWDIFVGGKDFNAVIFQAFAVDRHFVFVAAETV